MPDIPDYDNMTLAEYKALFNQDMLKDYEKLTDISMDALMSLTFIRHRLGWKDPLIQHLYTRFQVADIRANDPRYWQCCKLMFLAIDRDVHSDSPPFRRPVESL